MIDEKEKMRMETLAKAISSPVGRELLKIVLKRYLRPEVAGPLCDTVDGRLEPSLETVREAIQDAVLDSLNDGKITIQDVKELLSCINDGEKGEDEI